MSLLDDVTKKQMLTGIAIGVGASVLLPRLLPVLSQAAKPLIKGVMKSGLLFYEQSKETLAEITETTEDIWAEVKAEMEEEHLANLEKELGTVSEDVGGAEN